jgi:hypothetical protein
VRTFKIRDLMVALRPGIPTPKRLQPFDCCGSIQPEIEPFDDSVGCGDSCGIHVMIPVATVAGIHVMVPVTTVPVEMAPVKMLLAVSALPALMAAP